MQTVRKERRHWTCYWGETIQPPTFRINPRILSYAKRHPQAVRPLEPPSTHSAVNVRFSPHHIMFLVDDFGPAEYVEVFHDIFLHVSQGGDLGEKSCQWRSTFSKDRQIYNWGAGPHHVSIAVSCLLSTIAHFKRCVHVRESEVAQSCSTLCDPMDCSLPWSSVHGIFQARVLEWVAISFSRGSSQPRDRTWVSCIAVRCFTIWATREVIIILNRPLKNLNPFVSEKPLWKALWTAPTSSDFYFP